MIPPDTPIDVKTKKKEVINEVSATLCSNCGTTTTPLWRRSPSGETICNACGLYLKARNTLRPPSMKRNLKRQPPKEEEEEDNCPGTCPGGGQCNGTGGSASCEGCPAYNQHQVNKHALICANCRTTTTPLWRRDEGGNTICNACGLYYKLHGVHRPVSMKRSVIKRRKRIIVSENGEEGDELESSDDEEKEKEKRNRRIKLPSPVPAIEDYIVPKRILPPPIPPPKTPPHYPSTRFDPLYDYRTHLPPIKHNPLADFDAALTRLVRLSRRMMPEHSNVLNSLTHSLEDIITKAEDILNNNKYP